MENVTQSGLTQLWTCELHYRQTVTLVKRAVTIQPISGIT